MAKYLEISADQCGEVCVTKYIECTQRRYTGCVEVIRVCREECPKSHFASPVLARYVRAMGA